jgi:hypothetical protein
MHGMGWGASLRGACAGLVGRSALVAGIAAFASACSGPEALGLSPLGAPSLGAPAASFDSAGAGAAIRCERGALAHSWIRTRGMVYACAEAELPELARPDVWRGAAIAFYKLAPGEAQPQRIRDAASQAHEVEYWIDGNRLVWELRTVDPRSAARVPLVRQTLAIDGSSLAPAVQLLLEPAAPDPARVQALLTSLRRSVPSPALSEPLAKLLFELRNYGLREPRRLSDELDAAGRGWNDSTPAAGTLAQVLLELRLAQRAGAGVAASGER